jgi:thioesterase DpgC
VRAEPLVYDGRRSFPGLADARAGRGASEKMQRDKDGIEVDQGIFFAQICAHRRPARIFCHAMLLPQPESLARLPSSGQRRARSRHRGGDAQGKAATVFMRNPRYLNAEDEATLQQTEICGRSRASRSGERALRAARRHVDNPKYAGQARVLDRHQSDPHLHGKISTCGT